MKFKVILLCLSLSACSKNPIQNTQTKILREPASNEKTYNFEDHKIVEVKELTPTINSNETTIITPTDNENKIETEIKPLKSEIVDIKPIELKPEKAPAEKEILVKKETDIATSNLKVKMPKDYNKYNKLSIEPYMFFTNFKFTDLSTNEKGTIVSRSNFGFTVSWLQNWGTKGVKQFIKENKISDKAEDALVIESDFISRFFINYKKYIFINPPGSTLITKTKDQFSFGAGLSYEFLENLKLDLEVYYGQDIYFKSFTFDDANLLGTNLSLKWDFLKIEPYTLGLSLGTSYAKPGKVAGSYNAKEQLAYRGSLYLLYDTMKCEIGYELINKDSDYFEQKQSNVLFVFGASWAF